VTRCRQQGCEREAVAEVFWPGKPTLQCDEHAEKLVALGTFMGVMVSRRPLAPEPKPGKEGTNVHDAAD